MPQQITLENIKENLDFFHEMYDAVRLVDPLCKRVLEMGEADIWQADQTCYDYWARGAVCDNCISIRAAMDKKSYIKLEHNPGMLVMVTAIPLQTEENMVVLELLKNVTDSMMFGPLDQSDNNTFIQLVSEFNDKIVKDSLTSLYNHQYIKERLPVDIIKATLEKTPLSVAFLDFDGFKKINDTYGHLAGDMGLTFASEIMQKEIRKQTDWAARYGGDEFVICFHNTTYDEAYQICSRIRENMEKTPVKLPNDTVSLSFSFGIQTMHGEQLTAQEMLDGADKKMYEDKKKRKEGAKDTTER